MSYVRRFSKWIAEFRRDNIETKIIMNHKIEEILESRDPDRPEVTRQASRVCDALLK